MEKKLKLKNGNILYIMQDEDAADPREWDNLGTMICWHSRYNLGDYEESKEYNSPQRLLEDLAGVYVDDLLLEAEENEKEMTEEQAMQEVTKRAYENAIILPLGLYDHSGITMYIGSKAHWTDPGGWDSGQVGWIYVTREKIQKEYGEHGGRTDEEIEKYLEGEVETYDQYLTGDVYGFKLVKPVKKTWTCAETDEEEEEIEEEDVDSCWGFFGDNFEENGLYDHAGIKKEDVAEEGDWN